MTTPAPHPLSAAQREALEARFALRLSARLEEGVQSVSHDVSERLRVAREQAVRAAREARLAAAPVIAPAPIAVAVAGLSTAGGVSGTVSMGGWQESGTARPRPSSHRPIPDEAPMSWGWRIAAALPVLALVAGLWGIQRYGQHEQVQAATDVDMALLTDDLPPAAYADPGFAEFLRADTGPTVRPLESTPPEADGDLTTTEADGDLSTTETRPATSTP